jgi:hypothetical protein
MNKFLGLIILAAALTVSCERQENPVSQARKAVQFSASPVGTKTSYQGTPSGGKEAILWSDGDLFTVSCEEAVFTDESKTTANYKVTAPQGTATAVTPNAAEDLIYWGEGTHTFYAAYPAGKLNGNVVNASIASSQTMTQSSDYVFAPALPGNGYMVASATATPDAGNVNLVFKPVFSTLEFVVSAGNANVEVSDFSLISESTAIAGDYTITINADAPAMTFNASSTVISGRFGTSGKVALSNNQPLTFSVVILPRNVSGLKVRMKVNGDTVEFPLNKADGSPITFAGGKKSIVHALNILAPEAVSAGFTTVITDQDVDEYDLTVNP